MMSKPRLLIIDDERNLREFLGEALEAEGFDVTLAATARAGLLRAQEQLPQVVLLDQNLPDRQASEFLGDLRRLPSNPVIVMMTAFATYARAVEAIKAGAFQYITKPFEFSEILKVLSEALTTSESWIESSMPEALASIVGNSNEVQELRRRILRIARSPVETVLLTGESGTGKELVARALHGLSDRAERRLLCVNCAALTGSLLMSELFGHEKGAFTDARQEKRGVFETAHRGTLFLDEISEIDPRAQAALLRVLEQRVITRVGGTDEIPVDVRVVTATNGPLERSVETGSFRSDLYYRLNVVDLKVPALRGRGEDIRHLAHHFLEAVAARYGESPRQLAPEAEAFLLAYSWPGNVRELRNAIERAYVVGTAPMITAADLPPNIRTHGEVAGYGPLDIAESQLSFREAKETAVARFERDYVKNALTRTAGNISRAAERAGMHRQGFQRLLNRCGVDRDEFRTGRARRD